MSWGGTDPLKKREANRRYYLRHQLARQYDARSRYQRLKEAERIKQLAAESSGHAIAGRGGLKVTSHNGDTVK